MLEKVLLAHAPSMKRAQRGDVQAAIVAKQAQEAAAASAKAAKAAADVAAPPKINSKATKCPEFRGAISVKNTVKKIWCLKCKEDVNYTGWSDHCKKHHPVNGTGDVGDHSKEDDGKADVQKKPKGGHGKKEAAGAASKRCRKDSSGDHGIACKKVKPK